MADEITWSNSAPIPNSWSFAVWNLKEQKTWLDDHVIKPRSCGWCGHVTVIGANFKFKNVFNISTVSIDRNRCQFQAFRIQLLSVGAVTWPELAPICFWFIIVIFFYYYFFQWVENRNPTEKGRGKKLGNSNLIGRFDVRVFVIDLSTKRERERRSNNRNISK